MAQLTFETLITEGDSKFFHAFGHKLLYLQAGSFRGGSLGYDDPGGGSVKGYENEAAAWKTLSLAIQGTNSLRFVMPKDAEIEKYYLKHTELDDAINHISIRAFSSLRTRFFQSSPDHSIDIMDVTVVPGIITINGMTTVGLEFRGATKEWF